MFFNVVHLGCFLYFGLFKASIGHTIAGKTGTDVSVWIDFPDFPWLCAGIELHFSRITETKSSCNSYVTVMTFSDDVDQCVSNVTPEYESRIHNAVINFPTNVTFTLRNVSFQDAGMYLAMDIFLYTLGKSMLLVCENGGLEYSSTAVVTGKPDTTTDVCTETRMTTASRNEEIICTVDIIDPTVLSKEEPHISQYEYFVVGGVVAGIVLVTLVFLFTCKRCRRRRMESQGDDERRIVYVNFDIDYYPTMPNHEQGASEIITTARSVPLSGRRMLVTSTTEMCKEVGNGDMTDCSSESIDQSEASYITIY